VQGALSWFIGAYSNFAAWKATVDRLLGFHYAIEAARADAKQASGAQQVLGTGDGLGIDDVTLALPGGRTLVANANATIAPGESLLIRGPSGSGKSTLFRAIAGIWPFGSGSIRVPAGMRALFLPQRPYLPIGSLRQVVSYPATESGYSDHEIRDALIACGLPQLAGRLDEEQHWALQFSPGEQQRIAFARAILQKPAWLFLDEATSALDEDAEARLYGLLREKLPQTTIISIGHRPALIAFHSRVLELREDGSGTRALVAAEPA
jgi:putative ATP-binding cassette transporter